MTETKYENEGNHLRGRKKFDELRASVLSKPSEFTIAGEDTDFYLEFTLGEGEDQMRFYFLCEEDPAEPEDE